MKLLALMYHRARRGPHGNAPETLDAHFQYIAENYTCVLPGEDLDQSRLNVCLTFDDGYYDFYSVVYPLLRKHQLRAVLAVPPLMVCERPGNDAARRLEGSSGAEFLEGGSHQFCTWDELRELSASGLVSIAAHGYTHRALDQPRIDLDLEIVMSGDVLSGRLGQEVKTFVFPYGKFSPEAQRKAAGYYPYLFRIGGAANRSWDARVLYRVTADNLESPDGLFSSRSRARYRLRYFWNRLRVR